MHVRANHHAAIASNPVPPGSQQERDKPPEPDWGEMRRAKAWRQEHDPEWYEALSGPAHLGRFMGMVDVLGEPPKPKVKTAEDIEAERRRVLSAADSIWG